MARIQARLDRVLANNAWRALFTEAIVKDFPRLHSDHCPVFLQEEERVSVDKGRRPLRFQAMWASHEGCKNLVDTIWNATAGSVVEKCEELSGALTVWNRDSFGNICERKGRLKGHIPGLQRVLAEGRSHQLECL